MQNLNDYERRVMATRCTPTELLLEEIQRRPFSAVQIGIWAHQFAERNFEFNSSIILTTPTYCGPLDAFNPFNMYENNTRRFFVVKNLNWEMARHEERLKKVWNSVSIQPNTVINEVGTFHRPAPRCFNATQLKGGNK